jgi:hypothetical protein
MGGGGGRGKVPGLPLFAGRCGAPRVITRVKWDYWIRVRRNMGRRAVGLILRAGRLHVVHEEVLPRHHFPGLMRSPRPTVHLLHTRRVVRRAGATKARCTEQTAECPPSTAPAPRPRPPPPQKQTAQTAQKSPSVFVPTPANSAYPANRPPKRSARSPTRMSHPAVMPSVTAEARFKRPSWRPMASCAGHCSGVAYFRPDLPVGFPSSRAGHSAREAFGSRSVPEMHWKFLLVGRLCTRGY